MIGIGLAIACLGAAAAWASSGAGHGSASTVGRNQPVNRGATEQGDLTANNSPTLRADPRDPAHLAVANRVDSPVSACALHVSFDGGAGWSETEVPLPPGRAIGCFSPDIAFGADSTLYLTFTSFAAVDERAPMPDAVWLARSGDGGRTMSLPARAAGPSAFQVRVSTDPSRAARVYLTWLQVSGTSTWGFTSDGNPILVARSDDGGSTWGAPVVASTPSRRRVVAPSLVVNHAGQPALAFLDVGGDDLDYLGAHDGRGGAPYAGHWALVVARSTDEGRSWTESVVDDGIVPAQRFLALHPPAPSLAAAPFGPQLYVAFHDGRLGNPDILVWASGDGGRRWRAPQRIGDAPDRVRRSQYLPQLAVAPNGRLDALYYDRGRDEGDAMNSVSFASSFDEGRTFGRPTAVADSSFDPDVGKGHELGMPDLGDRLALVSTDVGALGVWTDTRAGRRDNGKQDLAAAVIAVTPPSRLTAVLPAAGVVATALGTVLVLTTIGRALARRRRRLRPSR